MKTAIIGAGAWGTALAIQASKSAETALWSYSTEEASLFNKARENVYYLPDVKIPEAIEITADIEKTLDADIWLFVPPSKFFRDIARKFSALPYKDKILVSATKGLEFPSEKRMSEILSEELSGARGVCVMSGPTHAEEVARGIPSSLVAASGDIEVARVVQDIFSTETFRVYTNDDVVGVEICGAVKNVIAVSAGMLRGLGYGDNTMAALVTRGLAEIRRLALIFGAKETTFSGLAGVGDLIVTCISRHSRNGRLGEELARGKTLDEVLASTKSVAEGAETVKTLKKLSEEMQIELPISCAVYDVLYSGADVLATLKSLMTRPLKDERE